MLRNSPSPTATTSGWLTVTSAATSAGTKAVDRTRARGRWRGADAGLAPPFHLAENLRNTGTTAIKAAVCFAKSGDRADADTEPSG